MILFILFSCVGCDQLTKAIARQNVPKTGCISLANDLFRFQYAENPGAFLSVGADIPETLRFSVFILLLGTALLGMLVYILRTRHFSEAQVIALAFILSGGFGNLLDRIYNEGRVIDFMNCGIGQLRTGVFNVADMAITFGAVGFFVVSLKTPKEE